MAKKFTLAKTNHERVARDSRWDEVRDNYLKAHPKCRVCGRTTDLQVHHIFPVSYIRVLGRPELELNTRNFMTLCESENGDVTQNHHHLLGHLANWRSMNEKVIADAKRLLNKTAAQIKADPKWKAEAAKKPKPAGQLTPTEKKRILKLIEKKFGKGK